MALITLVGLALRTYTLASRPLWLDEAYSLSVANHSLSEIWNWWNPAEPGDPPLYFILLNLVTGVHPSEVALRLPSVVFGTVLIPVTYLLAKVLGGLRIALTAAALTAVAPVLVWYSQDARMYSLLTLEMAVALLCLAVLMKQYEGFARSENVALQEGGSPPTAARPRLGVWAGYVLAVAAGLLTHHIVVIVAGIAAVAVLAWGWGLGGCRATFMRRWILANVIVLAIWATWIPGLITQLGYFRAEGAGLFPEIGLKRVVLITYEFLFPATWAVQGTRTLLDYVSILGAAALVAAVCWLGIRVVFAERRLSVAALLLIAITATYWLVVLFVSWVRPVFVLRVMVWTIIPLIVLLAIGLSGLRQRIGIAVSFLILVAFTWSLLSYYSFHKNADWDRAALMVANEARQTDVVLFYFGDGALPFQYYFQDAVPLDMVSLSMDDLNDIPAIVEGHPRAWLVYSHARPLDPSERMLSAVVEVGDLIERRDLEQVEVFLFEVRA